MPPLEIKSAGMKDGLLVLDIPIPQAYQWLESFKPGKYEITVYREKRSNSANAYCWKLCELIAERVQSEKEKIYKDHIREVGVYKDYDPLPEDQAKTLIKAWRMLGIGWQAEVVDWDQLGEKQIVRCYYGSSQYNTKQMSRLLGSLIEDARAVGIKTESDHKIESLLREWEEGEKRKKI